MPSSYITPLPSLFPFTHLFLTCVHAYLPVMLTGTHPSPDHKVLKEAVLYPDSSHKGKDRGRGRDRGKGKGSLTHISKDQQEEVRV